MPTFHIRLLETVTREGTGNFVLDDSNENKALATVADAYNKAYADQNPLVELPDGQIQFIEEKVVVSTTARYFLLDETDRVIREITQAD